MGVLHDPLAPLQIGSAAALVPGVEGLQLLTALSPQAGAAPYEDEGDFIREGNYAGTAGLHQGG
jgi:hypothetical protein